MSFTIDKEVLDAAGIIRRMGILLVLITRKISVNEIQRHKN